MPRSDSNSKDNEGSDLVVPPAAEALTSRSPDRSPRANVLVQGACIQRFDASHVDVASRGRSGLPKQKTGHDSATCQSGASAAGEPGFSSAARSEVLPDGNPSPNRSTRQYRGIEEEQDTITQNWLQLHAGELIERLRQWSADLDYREAELNARTAKQDSRERQFRLLQQTAQQELDEQQRAIDRLRKQMQDQARRLAFQVA